MHSGTAIGSRDMRVCQLIRVEMMQDNLGRLAPETIVEARMTQGHERATEEIAR